MHRLQAPGWAVLMPIKPFNEGKSRLSLNGASRSDLPRAIALDTIAAVRRSVVVETLVIVSREPELRMLANAPGVVLIQETELRGIDRALADADEAIGDQVPRAALVGDLAYLQPEHLTTALAFAETFDCAMVPDKDGTGTTMVTARAGYPLRTAFGIDSCARHLALGCARLPVPAWSTVRQDVDYRSDLKKSELGHLGEHTQRVLLSELSVRLREQVAVA